jgi:hypothetical protein
MVKNILSLIPSNRTVGSKDRFEAEFGPGEATVEEEEDAAAASNKPKDYDNLLGGNNDDCFQLGVGISRKEVSLYTEFYHADIIIASPLGLRRYKETNTHTTRHGTQHSTHNTTRSDTQHARHTHNKLWKAHSSPTTHIRHTRRHTLIYFSVRDLTTQIQARNESTLPSSPTHFIGLFWSLLVSSGLFLSFGLFLSLFVPCF